MFFYVQYLYNKFLEYIKNCDKISDIFDSIKSQNFIIIELILTTYMSKKLDNVISNIENNDINNIEDINKLIKKLGN